MKTLLGILLFFTFNAYSHNNDKGKCNDKGNYNSKSKVKIVNNTGYECKFQVQHKYTGGKTESSKWVILKNGESAEVLKIHYNTGIFTTGVDNWVVNGIQKRPIDAKIKSVIGSADINGQTEVNYHSGVGVLSSWKAHTLRSEDNQKTTVITINPRTVEFKSKSGTSSCGWVAEYEIF